VEPNSQITVNLMDNSPWYEEIRYPAGETQVRIRPEMLTAVEMAKRINVIARISNAQDIVSLLMLGSALEVTELANTILRLVLPYLPYSRADRRFTRGDCFGFRAFSEMLVCAAFTTVHTLDVHNEQVAKGWVPTLVNHTPLAFVHKAIADFAARHDSNRLTVLFPDEGARARYVIPGHLTSNTGSIRLDVLHCEKKRDAATGKFLGFIVPDVDAAQPAIVIDDICDGGGTFLGIAGELQKQHGDWWTAASLGLYVTHGIFSKGFGELNERFHHIYTTNSLPAKGPDKLVTVYDAGPILLS